MWRTAGAAYRFWNFSNQNMRSSGGATMGKFVIKETKTGVKFDLKATNG